MEARVGIEPTMDCFADSRLPTWLPRLLAGAGGIEPPLAVLETAALPLHHTPVLCLSVVKEQKKGPLFRAGLLRILIVPGPYPPPPRHGFVAMIVLSTWQWAHTNMRHGLPCRSHRVSGLGNLDILNSGVDGWILTSDVLLTGQVP